MSRSYVRDFGTGIRLLSASSQYGLVADGAWMDGMATLTVSAWVMPFTAAQTTGIVDHNRSGGWSLAMSNGQIRGEAVSGSTTDPNALPLRVWSHVAYVYNGVDVRIYVNGSLVGTPFSKTGNIGDAVDLYIGRFHDGAVANFNGAIDEVAIWNTNLTAAQIALIAQANPIPTTSLLAYYKFDEGSGTAFLDSSGNSRDGTWSATPTYTSDVPMRARTSATRVAVRDFGTALSFDGSTTKVISGAPVTTQTNNVSFGAWFKTNSLSSARQTIVYNGTEGGSGYGLLLNNAGSADGHLCVLYGSVAFNDFSASVKIKDRNWHHAIVTIDAANLLTLYLDGAQVYQNTHSGQLTPATRSTVGGDVGFFKGNIDEAMIWNTTLTSGEVTSLYNTGVVPQSASLKLSWLFNEGSGTSATDSSGNTNTGTITAATYTADVPMKARSAVGANLIKNGTFEFAPAFTAATTANNVWIDGTAAGSSTADLFGWGVSKSGTIAVQYDTAQFNSGSKSLKLSTTATNSYLEVYVYKADPDANKTAARPYLIPCLPSTSYTVTYYMKTNYTSGDSNDGAYITAIGYTGDGALNSATSGTKIKTTTGWTQYSFTHTTSATDRFIAPRINIYGQSGTATLIMDAWFDDVTLTPTTNTTRTAS